MIILNKKNAFIIFVALFCASLIFNGYLCFQVIRLVNDFEKTQKSGKVLAFRDMFVENVLLSDQEIDFDTRLAMEAAVRSLDDKEVLSQWQKFTNCKTQEDASLRAKELLRLLIEKSRN